MKSQRHTEGSALKFIKFLIPVLAISTIMCFVLLRTSDEPGSRVAIRDTPAANISDNHFGLPETEGFDLVKGQCSGCHSLQLVAQNKLTRQGWKDLIHWMQREQNLWPLGELEKPILDYLEKNCAPTQGGRRKALAKTTWYALD